MGQFSRIYSDTNKQVVDDKRADTYLLVPPPFQGKYGKAIYEPCYNGYGRYGSYDVYDLIAEWNKEIISEIVEKIKNGEWHGGDERDIPNFQAFYEGKEIDCELRWLGIVMACYDEDNASLKYPVKITTKVMEYDDVKPSPRDPKQGWEG